MNGITISSRGEFASTLHSLKQMRDMDIQSLLHKYARIGVEKLSVNTPEDTGLTRDSWYYEISGTPGSYRIDFCNSNVGVSGFHVAWFLEYGHATKNGGWVEGTPYIGPSLEETFEEMVSELFQKIGGY